VDVSFLVGVKNENMDKNDLGFTKVGSINEKSLDEIAKQMRSHSEKIIKGLDEDKKKN